MGTYLPEAYPEIRKSSNTPLPSDNTIFTSTIVCVTIILLSVKYITQANKLLDKGTAVKKSSIC